MSDVIKMKTPFAIITILIIVLLVESLIDPNVIPQLKTLKDALSSWSVIIFNFAAITAAISMMSIHTRKIAMTGNIKDKYYSGLLVGSFAVTVLLALTFGFGGSLYNDYYLATNQVVGSIIGGALGFIFISMGAYRALRVNTIEALVLFIGGMAFVLMEMPVMVAFFPFLTPIGDWILNILGGSSYRAGIIASAAGVMIVGLRMILQREKSALG